MDNKIKEIVQKLKQGEINRSEAEQLSKFLKTHPQSGELTDEMTDELYFHLKAMETEETMLNAETDDAAEPLYNEKLMFKQIMRKSGLAKDEPSKEGFLSGFFSKLMKPAYTGGLAAVAALVLVVVFYPAENIENSGYTGQKGVESNAAAVDLSFLIAHRDESGKPALEKGVRNSEVSDSKDIMFRYSVKEAGYVYIYRVAKYKTELIFPFDNEPVKTKGGVHDIKKDDSLQAFPLKGLLGAQRFVLLLSEKPLEKEPLEKELKEFFYHISFSKEFKNVKLDYFDIKVISENK